MIDDAGPSPAMRALTERHGARYEPHPAPLGLNVARNTGVERSSGELVVFVDDDVRVRPGWLQALLDAARAAPGCRRLHRPDRTQLEGRAGRARLRPRGAADHLAAAGRARHGRTLRLGRQHDDPPLGAAARRPVRGRARSTAATSRSGRTACARGHAGRARALRRRRARSSTVAPAPTRNCARSHAPPTCGGAPAGASTAGVARRRRVDASCSRSAAASGTCSAAAAPPAW